MYQKGLRELLPHNHSAASYSYPATCARDKIGAASFTHPVLKMGWQPDPVAHTYPAS